MGRITGELAYRRALRTKNDHDFAGSDACDHTHITTRALEDASLPHPLWEKMLTEGANARVPFGGKVIAHPKGMGKVYDWRGTGWSQSNGGRIPLLLFVDHIPVIPNMPGVADFIRLRDVLYAQGLRIQCATDASGNVALFTPFNRLCYQARGANSFSVGCEHMHYGINDPWTDHQLNAASYVHWLAREYHRLPTIRDARLGAGNGIVRPLSKGRTTHKAVSHFAGYDDRSDPGPTFEAEWERINRGVLFFDRHGSFDGL